VVNIVRVQGAQGFKKPII